MELVANILLASASLAAGLYCYILGARLKKFNSLEKGVGGAVSVLSSQVQELTDAVNDAKAKSDESTDRLNDTVERAEAASKKIEIQLAALNGLNAAEEDAKKDYEVEVTEPIFTRRVAGG